MYTCLKDFTKAEMTVLCKIHHEKPRIFLGEATCNDFFTGRKDEHLSKRLYDTIKSLNPEICVEGHWVPVDTEDTLADLCPIVG